MDHPQDHFSSIANAYNAGRISYPEELYTFLAGQCEEQACAWDCATGSGQAAADLSKHFHRVIATDISDSLLSHATKKENIVFRAAPAESSGITTSTIDLVTVAQAIHWFELDKFWDEAVRVLKPNGILAFWGYVWPVVNDQIDSLFKTYRTTIADYWPEKIHYLQRGYVNVDAPLKRLGNPNFYIMERWTASQYLKHLSSWSGTRYYREALRADPVSEIEEAVNTIWGDEIRTVKWSLILKVYQKTE